MRTALALVLGVVALGGCTSEAPPLRTPIAAVISAAGSVQVEREGARQPASVDLPLFARDVVVTGTGGLAVIRFVDGTRIAVDENTRFTVNGAPGRLTLELEQGSIVSDSRAAGGELRIITRYGTAEILRGSEVQFRLSDAGGSMDVAFGEIRMVGADGGASRISAGRELVFDLPGEQGDSMADAGVADTDAGTQESQPAGPKVLVWRFAAPKGSATVRAPGEKRPAPANAEPSEIEPGTQFQVRPKRMARLLGEEVDFALEGRSKGAVGEALREGDVDRHAFSLAEGEGVLRLTGDRERELTVTGRGRTARIHAREEATLRIRQTKKGLEVEALAGQIEVAGAEGDPQPVRPGERASIAAARVKLQAAARPAIVIPHSRRVKIFSSGLGPVGLAVPVTDPPARVQVARDAKFETPFLSGRAHGEVLVVRPPPRGELFWRALNAGGEVLATGHARFDRDRARAQLDNPRAEVAETGLKASVFFQSALPAITFSFAPNDAARQYAVRVYRAADLNTPVAEKVVAEPRCAFEAGRLPEGDYVWHAAPLDANGAELAGGRMNRLEIVYDNSHTTLAIARPRIGEKPNGPNMPVEGVAPIGSRLFVNGKPAVLDRKGRFKLDVRRSDAVVFRLVSDSGAESWWVRSARSRQ